MKRLVRLAAAGSAFLVLLALSTVIGGGTRTEAADPAVEAAIKADIMKTAAAWNAKNVPDFLAGFTDQGLKDILDFPDRATAQQELPSFIGEDHIELVSLTGLAVAGNNAEGYMLLSIGSAYDYSFQSFILENGRWKFAAAQTLNAPIPQGTNVLNVSLKEYQFVFDKSQVASGKFAINATNTGTQQHEIIVFKNDSGKPIRDAFLAAGDEEEPEGVTFIGAADELNPAQNKTVVFTQSLAPGNYGFVCFLPDANGTPHFINGMTADFVVGSGASTGGTTGGTLSPPKTGDGSLADDSATLLNVYTVLGAALLAGAFGLSGVVAARHRA